MQSSEKFIVYRVTYIIVLYKESLTFRSIEKKSIYLVLFVLLHAVYRLSAFDFKFESFSGNARSKLPHVLVDEAFLPVFLAFLPKLFVATSDTLLLALRALDPTLLEPGNILRVKITFIKHNTTLEVT